MKMKMKMKNNKSKNVKQLIDEVHNILIPKKYRQVTRLFGIFDLNDELMFRYVQDIFGDGDIVPRVYFTKREAILFKKQLRSDFKNAKVGKKVSDMFLSGLKIKPIIL